MLRLTDVMSMAPATPVAVRLGGREASFRLGPLMDRINSRSILPVLRVTFDATHSGTIVNNRVYPGKHMRASARYWTFPFNKAIVSHHPPKDHDAPEPTVFGRVGSAEFVPLVPEDALAMDWKKPSYRDKGSGFIRLVTKITHPQAIEEVITGRFLTVSSGMDTDHLFCSACGNDWSTEDGRCEHLPGRPYKMGDSEDSSIMYFVTGMLFYDHLARVNTPAQPYSTVLGAEWLETNELRPAFTGEVLNGSLERAVLVDSHDGEIEILFDRQAPQPTSSWTVREWAEARILTALADTGRLRDRIPAEAEAKIKAFRTSDRKPDFGLAKVRVGPDGVIPICDLETANAALTVVRNGFVKVADAKSLESRILECADSLGCLTTGDGSMTKTPSQEWDDVITMAEGMDQGQDVKCDWSDFDGDLNAVVYEDGLAEENGVAAGIIAADKKLTAEARKRLPDSTFCGPNRSFPVPDASHVRNALARLPNSNYNGQQKARILACVRRAAKRHGVEASRDQLEYNKLVSMLDKKPPLEPAATESPEQRAKQISNQLEAATARVKDLESANGRLIDEMKNLNNELRRMLASKVMDTRETMKKADVLNLSKPEDRQQYMDKLALRSLESLRDALSDLQSEAKAAAVAAAVPVNPPSPPPPPVSDPTDSKKDQIQDSADKKAKAEAEAAAKAAEVDQINLLTGDRGQAAILEKKLGLA